MMQCQLTMLSLRLSYDRLYVFAICIWNHWSQVSHTIPFWCHVTDLSQVLHTHLVLSLLGPGFNSLSLDINESNMRNIVTLLGFMFWKVLLFLHNNFSSACWAVNLFTWFRCSVGWNSTWLFLFLCDVSAHIITDDDHVINVCWYSLLHVSSLYFTVLSDSGSSITLFPFSMQVSMTRKTKINSAYLNAIWRSKK